MCTHTKDHSRQRGAPPPTRPQARAQLGASAGQWLSEARGPVRARQQRWQLWLWNMVWQSHGVSAPCLSGHHTATFQPGHTQRHPGTSEESRALPLTRLRRGRRRAVWASRATGRPSCPPSKWGAQPQAVPRNSAKAQVTDQVVSFPIYRSSRSVSDLLTFVSTKKQVFQEETFFKNIFDTHQKNVCIFPPVPVKFFKSHVQYQHLIYSKGDTKSKRNFFWLVLSHLKKNWGYIALKHCGI